MRRLFLYAPCLMVGSVSLGGCFGRTGLVDDERFGAAADDATADTGIGVVEAGSEDTATTDTRTEDRFIDIWDVFPIPDSGPIGACASCVRDKCGDSVNKCINDPKCRAGLACTVTRCLAGGGGGGGGPGGFDFMCILGCFDGDFAAAGTAISTFSCVLGTCGSVCGGLIGGGLPGGGGGGGGGSTDGGKPGGMGGGSGGMGSGFAPKASWTPAEVAAIDPATRISFAPEAFAPWRETLHASACEQKLISCSK
jgi:hypothetical protein